MKTFKLFNYYSKMKKKQVKSRLVIYLKRSLLFDEIIGLWTSVGLQMRVCP